MNEIREKIANEIFNWMIKNHEIDCSTVEFGYLADKILSSSGIPTEPTGIWAVKECDNHGKDENGLCTNCGYSSNTISRQLTWAEVGEVMRKTINDHCEDKGDAFYYSGERLEVRTK